MFIQPYRDFEYFFGKIKPVRDVPQSRKSAFGASEIPKRALIWDEKQRFGFLTPIVRRLNRLA